MLSLSLIQILFVSPTVIYQNCMEDYSADCQNHGWSIQRDVMDCSGKYVIGKYELSESVKKTFNVPPNRKLRFNITIYKIDTWDISEADSVDLFENITLLKKFKAAWNEGTPLCPGQGAPELIFDYSGEFIDESLEITITQQGNFNQPMEDESWGFRAVSLEVIVPCVNFYSECNYAGELFKMCSGEPTLEQKTVPFTIKSLKMVPGSQVTLLDPNYQSGQSKTYTQDQNCLDDFQFPKLVPKDD